MFKNCFFIQDVCETPGYTCLVSHRTMERRPAHAPTHWDERAMIVWMWQEGVSARDISHKTGASIATVYRWIRRWSREGSFTNSPRRRRARIALDIDSAEFIQALTSGLPPVFVDGPYTWHSNKLKLALCNVLRNRRSFIPSPNIDWLKLLNLDHCPQAIYNISPSPQNYMTTGFIMKT